MSPEVVRTEEFAEFDPIDSSEFETGVTVIDPAGDLVVGAVPEIVLDEDFTAVVFTYELPSQVKDYQHKEALRQFFWLRGDNNPAHRCAEAFFERLER